MSIRIEEYYDRYYVHQDGFGLVDVFDSAEEAKKFASSDELKSLIVEIDQIKDKFNLGLFEENMLFIRFNRCNSGLVVDEDESIRSTVDAIINGDYDEDEENCSDEE